MSYAEESTMKSAAPYLDPTLGHAPDAPMPAIPTERATTELADSISALDSALETLGSALHPVLREPEVPDAFPGEHGLALVRSPHVIFVDEQTARIRRATRRVLDLRSRLDTDA